MTNIKDINKEKPHDKFAKRSMSLREVHQDFFEKHLPDDIKALTDLSTITPCPTINIDPKHNEFLDDLVFRADIANSDAYITLLVEHQSRAEKMMPFRILKYTVGVIEAHRDHTGKEEVPLVFPIVLYQNRKRYKYSNDIRDLIKAPKELIDKYFLKPFHLIDLADPQVQQTLTDDQSFCTAFFKILIEAAAKRNPLKFSSFLKITHEIDPRGLHKFTECVVAYVGSLAKGNEEKRALVEAIESFPDEFGDNVMNLIEEFRNEGYVAGRDEGYGQAKRETVLSMAANGLEVSIIKKVTDLTDAEIEQILK